MSAGHIITSGLGGQTLVTRGYGVSAFTAIIIREVKRIASKITQSYLFKSKVG